MDTPSNSAYRSVSIESRLLESNGLDTQSDNLMDASSLLRVYAPLGKLESLAEDLETVAVGLSDVVTRRSKSPNELIAPRNTTSGGSHGFRGQYDAIWLLIMLSLVTALAAWWYAVQWRTILIQSYG